MESLPRKPEDDPKKPDQTGEQDTSKKRRKKSTKVLKKTIGKSLVSAPENEPVKSARRRTLLEIVDELKEPEQPQTEEAKDSKEPEQPAETVEPILPPLELPETDGQDPESPREDKFLGEIIIDHTPQEIPLKDDERPVASDPIEVSAPAEVSGAQEPDTTAEIDADSAEAVSKPSAPEAELIDIANAELEGPTVEQEPSPQDPPRVAPPFTFTVPVEHTSAESETQESPAEAESSNPFRPLAEPLRHVQERLRAQRAEVSVSETEARNREYRAEKRGLSRGVVTGGLTGWWLGRRGRKELSREVKATRAELKERDQKLEALSRERQIEAEAAKSRLSVVARTQAEMKKLMQRTWDREVLKRTSRAEVPLQTTRVVEVPAAPVPESAQPVFEPIKEAFKPTFRPFEEDSLKTKTPEASIHEPVLTTEAVTPSPAEQVMKAKPEAQPIEDQPITEETYMAPEGHRVEMSAWHRVEVDNKTGKATENPQVTYGEAFKHEQQQERLAADAAKAQTAAQVGMTLLYGGTEETKTPLAPPNYSYSKPLKPQLTVRSQTTQAIRTVAQQTTNPITWVVALGLVTFLFLVGILH